MSGSGRIHDRELLDALEAINPEKYDGETWRTTWASRDPLVGNQAGGRWNPPDSFEALYTSLEADGSLSETYYHLSKAPIFPSANVKLFRLHVVTENTLRLDQDALINLGIDETLFQRMDYARSQEIGAAAHMLEFDSLLVPSARSAFLNLVLFLDRIDPGKLQAFEGKAINWPAWKETRN